VGSPLPPPVEDTLRSVSLSTNLSDLAQAVQNLVKKQERLETRLDVIFTSMNPRLDSRLDSLLTNILDCLHQNGDAGLKGSFISSPDTTEYSPTPRMPSPRSSPALGDGLVSDRSNETPRFELNCSKPIFGKLKAIAQTRPETNFEEELKIELEEKARDYPDDVVPYADQGASKVGKAYSEKADKGEKVQSKYDKEVSKDGSALPGNKEKVADSMEKAQKVLDEMKNLKKKSKTQKVARLSAKKVTEEVER